MTNITKDVMTVALDYVHMQYNKAKHPCSSDAVRKQSVIDAVKNQLENGVEPKDVKIDPETINRDIMVYIADALKDIDPQLWRKMQVASDYCDSFGRNFPDEFRTFEKIDKQNGNYHSDEEYLSKLCWSYAQHKGNGNVCSFLLKVAKDVENIENLYKKAYYLNTKIINLNDIESIKDAYISACHYKFLLRGGADIVKWCENDRKNNQRYEWKWDEIKSDLIKNKNVDEVLKMIDDIASEITNNTKYMGDWAIVR